MDFEDGSKGRIGGIPDPSKNLIGFYVPLHIYDMERPSSSDEKNEY